MRKSLQTLALSIFILIPFLVKADAGSPRTTPPVAEGSVGSSCDIDPGSIPLIQDYASNCFTEELMIPIECTINAPVYRSYCRDADHESAEACLGRHHCSASVEAARTTPAPAGTPSFLVTLRDLQMSARVGENLQVPFFVIRQGGFTGEVAMTLRGAPGGITADAFTMPRDRVDANLTLHLASSLAAQDYQIVLEGTNASMTRVSVPLTLHITSNIANIDHTLVHSDTNQNPQNASEGGACSLSIGTELPFNSLWIYGMGFVTILAVRMRRR